MKIIHLFTIVLVLLSCKDTKKADYMEIGESPNNDLEHSNAEHPGKKIVETQCYVCHDATTSEENRIAPPMIAVKRRYLMGGKTKNEFINDILAWSKKPSLEKSKMPGAVERFGVMPYLPYPDEDIRKIAEYLYDYEIDQPDWFEEHYQKNHGKGQGVGMGRGKGNGQGMGMGRGQGNGMGIGKQQGIGQAIARDNYSSKGLKYALSTKAQLGKNLLGTIQEKGTIGAVEFCKLEAIKLTDSMANVHNANIRRVSDKPRNPNNKANDKEVIYINAFKQMAKKGIDINPMTVEDNNEVHFYYPIITNTMCLQCHGKPNEEVTSETLLTLKKLYPTDQALGYDENQVRGIWSIVFDQ